MKLRNRCISYANLIAYAKIITIMLKGKYE